MHKSMISYPGIRKAVIIKTVQQPVGLNITDDQIRKFQVSFLVCNFPDFLIFFGCYRV